jgi:exopolysaccharide biosynthesis WecB/TagA/CpsF family protein
MKEIQEQIDQLPFIDTTDSSKVVKTVVREWMGKNNAVIVHYMYYASYVLMHTQRNLLKAYQYADYLLVDGVGMQLYLKIVTGRKVANLNGTDMSPLFLEELIKKNIPICLYGTTDENIQQCAINLKDKYHEGVVTYYQNGFSPLDWDKIPEKSALFVGTGSPRQEIWAMENIAIIQEKQLLVFTVGGYLDFLSGFYIRAPKWVRAIKMEWAFRTMLHPGRHYQKRIRDTTILFRPWIDKLKGYSKFLHFRNI